MQKKKKKKKTPWQIGKLWQIPIFFPTLGVELNSQGPSFISDVQTNNEYVNVLLSDGRFWRVGVPTIHETLQQQSPDRQKDYFHHALEVGTVFSLFIHEIKVPQREKLLPLFKMMMMILKGQNTKAKYPLEILRLLVQQYSLLPLQVASQVLHDCFVNTKGKPDSHVPADQQMEWLVKLMKKHIKHMYSQKTENNISNKTSALPGIQEIVEQFDKTAQVLIRCSRHNEIDAKDARIQMVKDFSDARPFDYQEDRSFKNDKFKMTQKSSVLNLDHNKLKQWFEHHKNLFEA